MRKVIITGAGGFIGRNLSLALLKKGTDVYGIDISENGFEELKKYSNFFPIVASQENLDSLDVLKGKNIEMFIHLGWGGSLLSTDLNNLSLQLLNIEMSMSYLKKIVELGIKKVIFGSTSYQYMVDNDTDILCNYYGIAKKTTEDLFIKYCYEHNVECNIAILTNTFGWGDYSQKAVNSILIKMINNESLSLVEGNYENDWVYIEDTIEGLISIAERGKNLSRYYIGHENITTFKSKILEMAKITNYTKKLSFGEYLENCHVDYSLLNANKLFEDTGFRCHVDFKKSIELTIFWLKKRGI